MLKILIVLFFPLLLIGQSEYIGTVQLHPKNNIEGLPIIELNNQRPLLFSFDYLGEDAPYLTYKIEHCTADWKVTSIPPIQYIQGFNQGDIPNYEFSFNTNRLYTHYEMEFPNINTTFKISGNYQVSVYNDYSGKPLFSQRFMVTEQGVLIRGNVGNASGIGKLQTHQQVDFDVVYENYVANNPRQEFQVNVMQNRRIDNQLIGLEPFRITGKELYFNNPFKQSFAAGNEFRWFSTESVRYRGQSVAEIIHRKDSTTHVYLIPDLARKPSNFVSYSDMNGMFYIRKQEAIDSSVEAEYVYVHFTLKENEALKDKPVYVFGGLTNWQIKPEYQLHWNERQNLLEAILPLKQGNYDYQYVVDEGDEYSVTHTEGDSFRTENDYTIFVYYKPFGSRYDRLVGVSQLNSRF